MASVKEQLESDLGVLQANKVEWAGLNLSQKIQLLKEVHSNLLEEVNSFAKTSLKVKGTEKDSSQVSTELVNLIVAPSTWIHRMLLSLESLQKTGACSQLKARSLQNGQTALQVWPLSLGDTMLLLAPMISAEVYVQKGKPATQGAEYLSADRHSGQVAVVLGAGNHSFLSLLDILGCLFEHRQVVIFKPHPLQREAQEHTRRILTPLIDRGYLRFASYIDSVSDAEMLLMHPNVDCAHMTGGIKTHDAIVWGATAEEQQRRKAANDPKLKVPMSSELGAITPVILVAGDTPWTPSEMKAQARNIALGISHNVSCNCAANKVMLVPEAWPQRAEFLKALKEALAASPMQPAFYPGIGARYKAWKEKYPDAEAVSAPFIKSSKDFTAEDVNLQYMIHEMASCPAAPEKEYALQVEPFAPVFNIIPIPAKDTSVDFMTKASAFANEYIWGTLSCTVTVHPSVEKAHKQEFEQMLIDLEYGTIGVNAWSAYSLALGSTTWGAYPGKTPKDCSSGVGVVHNTMLIDYPEKSVYRGPFTGLACPEAVHFKPFPPPVLLFVLGFISNGFLGGYKALTSK